MIKNYLKIAWRSLSNNRFFSSLNIVGLAVSIAVAILLITFARQQLSFNTQFAQADHIHRLVMEANAEYNFEKWTTLPNAVGPTMVSDIPEVKSMARFVKLDFVGFGSVQANGKNFYEKNIYLTDSTFFSLFDVAFNEGNARTAFANPKSIVISASRKNTLFGHEPALDQKIVINQRDTLRVSGVFEDLPSNSSFDGDIYLNIMDSWMGKNVHWSNASYHTFCLLTPGSNAEEVERKATALIDKYVPKDNQYYTQFFLQPLAKIHLHSSEFPDTYSLSSQKGNINTVKTVLGLSLLVILIACINYMNLATARAQKNAKEVGMSKVLGAQRRQITLRFYLETSIISLGAIVLGLGFTMMAFPLFTSLINTDISIGSLFAVENLWICLGIWLAITFIGGSYPAFLMANIPSLSLMKNLITQGVITQYLRKGLVIFQFTCSIILIIGVIVMSLQMRHVYEKDLGYQPTNILTIPINAIKTTEQLHNLKQSILNLAGTSSIATVQSFPGFAESGKTVRRPGDINEGLPTTTSSSHGAVVQALGLDLLAGSDLPDELTPNDTNCYVLINEIVASYLGFDSPQEAVGKQIPTEMASKSTIAGVVRNFNFNSLKAGIGGYMYYRMNRPSESYRYFLVRYDTQHAASYVDRINDVFNQHLPDVAFDYQFLDDYVQNHYAEENQTSKIITTFSMITIFIACLGLFGLAAFTAEQRKKEIGVRKVLGASIFRIVNLLSRNFLVLILLSLLIASPIAWGLFSHWLEDFNDKITIPWWSFVLAGAFAVGIASSTVGYQAIRAARANPIHSLRNE